MKTNLDKLFKNDESREKEGVWFQLSDEVGFLIKRFGGNNHPSVKAAIAKHHKPYSRQIEMGTLSDKKSAEIMTRVFVESCITDWKGIEIDGEVKQFDKELCIKFLIGLPELADTLLAYASDTGNYRESLGNS